MASKSKALLLLLSVFLLSSNLALSYRHHREDPERRLGECRQECRQQQQQHGRGSEERRRQCERRCEEEYRERRERREEGNPRREEEEKEERWEMERGTEKNPYFFDRQSFRQPVRTEHGNIRVLQRFSERSELLRGVDKFRFAILEADPHGFVMPHHLDADVVLYVIKGRASITAMCGENKRESHDLRRGDIYRVQAGSVVYLVNKDSSEKLEIAELLRPVAIPGQFEAFSGAGGEESFFESFSSEVLEAAFNTTSDRVRRMVAQGDTRGAIVRASEEQIRALSRHASEGGPWPLFGQSQRPFNLLHKRATHSSRRGELYDADAGDYQQLKDLNIRISFANISSGSMIAPFYNSRATKISVVTEGRGYVEMVCPHLARRSHWREARRGRREGSEEREEEQREREHGGRQGYRRVRSELSAGTVFIEPAGHPTTVVASEDRNLQVVCFEICAENNERIFLAGRNNVLNQLQEAAKELSFGVPAREVDEVLRAQREEVFVAGPQERREGGERRREEREEGRPLPFESLLGSVAF